MNEWAQKFAELQKQKGTFNMQPQQSKTPTWDEIDKIMDSLTDTQKNYLNQNQDFVESYQDVANILQREELRIIRLLVEQTKDGKEALEKHQSLIKKLRKNAMQAAEEEEKTALWNEYMTYYSDMTFKTLC
jgi:arsenate reductase-like glutaredoxin family protein